MGPHCTGTPPPPPPPLEMFKLVHYEARTVGKWLVGRNAFVSSRLLGYFGMAEFILLKVTVIEK